MADRRQIARIAGLLLAVALVVVVNFLIMRRGAAPVQPVATGKRDAGVPSHSSEPPKIPIQRPDGVRLAGFVVDSAGLPVAGAEVTAGPEQGVPSKAALKDAGIDDVPLAVAVAPPTAADGRFSIDGLPPGRYKLEVKGPGLLPAELRYVQVPSDATRIVVARQVSIDGTVLDGTQPAGNIHVGVRGEPVGGTVEVTTDDKGTFHVPDLPEGRYQVFAYGNALAARAVRVNRVGTGPFGAVELHLEPAAIVVGRVLDRDEGTGVIAEIELRPSGDDQAPRYARSGDDGVFRIEGVPNGRWIAEAFAPGYLTAAGIELEAGHGIPELQLGKGGVIEGRVLDGDGHPIEGATVRALGKDQVEVSEAVDKDRLRRYAGRTAAPVPVGATGDDPELLPRGELGVMLGPIPPIPPPGGEVAMSAASTSMLGDPPPLPGDAVWTTAADGRYRITGVPKGTFTAAAVAPELAEGRGKPVDLGKGEVRHDVDIVLTAGTYLVGTVTDQHRVPVVGAQVSAQPELGVPSEGFTDAAGEYRIGPLAGSLKVHASAYGHVDADTIVDLPAPHGRTAGEQRQDIVLEVADATVAGTVDDEAGAPIASAHLSVLGGRGEGRHAISLADGTFSIDMLPSGPLRLHVEHPDYPAADFDAVAATTGAGAPARIRVPIGGAVEGAVLDNTSGSPMSSVTLTGNGPGAASAEATTDKSGQWKLGPLRPGRWKLAIKLPGYLAASRELDVPAAHAPGGTSVRDIRIDLLRGAIVGGTVRDASGKRVMGAHVVAHAIESGLDCEGDTDADGEFRIRDCPTGELDLAATKGDARGTVRATVRPADEIFSLQIDIQ